MDRRALLSLSLVLLIISVTSTATEEDVNQREQRGFFLNTLQNGGKFLGLFQNYTAAKLIKNTSLLATILNTTSPNLFTTKKIAFWSALANATADLITAKSNYTDFKLIKKLALLTNSTTLGIKSVFNTSTTFLNDLLTAKLALKNSTLTAKLQFANASGIALQAALQAKANKTETKLALFSGLNSTTFSTLLADKINKKNFSSLFSDSLADKFLEFYNLTTLENDGFLDKFNKTVFTNHDDNENVDNGDDYQVEYQIAYV